MSRPRSDRLELVERIALVLAADPGASANAVHRRVGGRRTDVLRVVRAVRRHPVPREPLDGRVGRFPNPYRAP